MTKAQLSQDASGKWLVRDSRTGRFVEVRGADSMKDTLVIRNGVDLTKPIAKQVLGGRANGSTGPRGGSSRACIPRKG